MKCINENCQKEIGDVKFCPYCGTKQEKPKVYCVYCGAEMDAVYCNECGKKSFFVQQRELEEQNAREGEAEKEAEAREEYADLMSDLVPDLVSGREKIEYHLFFVKKLASQAGWDAEDISSALSDLVSMYMDFEDGHPGHAFSGSEKKLIAYQARLAHIGDTVLETIF